ncbi:MAG: mechanosensitive ion channel family protein [Desertifilum sp. SIO1I2]|nr:mechanosensitive ion channel family protein [Desertifilum sp. SIO1I2]
MKTPKSIKKAHSRKSNWWSQSTATVVAVGITLFSVNPTVTSRAWGQTEDQTQTPAQQTDPNLQEPGGLSRFLLPFSSTSDLVRGDVRIDGRRVFSVAAPAAAQLADSADVLPLEQRISDIERTLHSVVEQNSEDIDVTAAIDAQSRLPVLSVSVNGQPSQYLMTVTTLDAQIYGVDPNTLAERLTQRIQAGLSAARQERRPEFLVRQALLAGTILALALIASSLMLKGQRYLNSQQEEISQNLPKNSDLTGEPPVDGMSDSVTSVSTVEHQMTQLQERNIREIQRRLLQVGQVANWGSSTYLILGLFPHTRWLRPLAIAALQIPLTILTIGVGTYLAVRVSAVLIDRFFVALERGNFGDPEASQRMALRFSTFSQVFKGITAVTLGGVGILSILSVVGVNIGPLLAGAGILGLGISFAAQSLIKDTINGFFILLEDQYAVGDVIAVGTVSGLVENMNLRITQLRNAEGRLITVPNSEIAIVENLSKDWSRVDVAIDVSYGSDVDRALSIIDEVAQKMSKEPVWREKIIDPPQVLGIDQISHMGVLIRVWIKTKPLEQWSVAREYRRRLKIALDQQGIAIGVPQQSLWLPNSSEKLAQTLLDAKDKAQELQTSDGHSPSNGAS